MPSVINPLPTIVDAEHSFVRFHGPDMSCGEQSVPPLPVNKLTDISFQLNLKADTEEDIMGEPAIAQYVYRFVICSVSGCISGAFNVALPDAVDWYGIAAITDSTPDSATAVVAAIANEAGVTTGAFDSLEVGDCFRICMIRSSRVYDLSLGWIWSSNPNAHKCLAASNLMVKSADKCTESVIRYRCNEDSFGFVYEIPYLTGTYKPTNSVRLPFLLKEPVLISEEKSYTKSNGEKVKLYERKEEEYMLETDWMPYWWHRALDIALSHDTVSIQNNNIQSYNPYAVNTRWIKEGGYEPEYIKDYKLSKWAKGKAKLKNAQAYHLANNNCG